MLHGKRMAQILIIFVVISQIMCACGVKSLDKVETNNDIKASKEERNNDISSNEFLSTDESVTFSLNISKKRLNEEMPEVEVVPHYLNTDDIQRVIKVLFGETEVMEADDILYPTYSKEELQERIAMLTRYVGDSAIQELYGAPRDYLSENIKNFIENYTAQYETAPDTKEQQPCQWKFYKESYYWTEPTSYKESDYPKDCDQLDVQLCSNGIPYRCQCITRNKNDFKMNMISIFPYNGISPDSINDRIYRSELCRMEKPADSMVNHIKDQSSEILKSLSLGNWEIDQCDLETVYYGDTPEYSFKVHAVPMFAEVAAIRHPQLTDITSTDVYASNYYISEVEMEFSPTGQLITFNLMSPLDIIHISDENKDVLSLEELLQKAKTNLSYSDLYQYGIGDMINLINEEVECRVNIHTLQEGLIRVRIPNCDDHYKYIPGFALYGNIEYIGRDSGKCFFSNENVLLTQMDAQTGAILQ